MGNILQIAIDGAIFNRCLDCFLGKAAYIRNLQENVVALETELPKLIEAKNDVMERVVNAERQPMMSRLNKVQGWLSRVDAVKAEADELIRDGSQEIEKLCLGGYCSKNCMSSYKFGKQVAKKLSDVKSLIGQGDFEEVAKKVPEPAVDERPTEPTVVGLQLQLERVWKCLVEESAGIIGLYGMGGVGKTTLLTHINNKFLGSPTDFDCVIWVVASKDMQIEKIQESIWEKIGLLDDTWKNRRIEPKARDIFRILKEKKFLLLLDDIWQRVDLTAVGVPLPGPHSASKVVFTTRSEEVCGWMEAHKKFKVECLSENDAWELFRQKVGEETLNCHPHIPELAETVAKECGGLPLALIIIGRAMACKKTPEEWSYAVHLLRTSSSQFPGLGNELYPLLKFSYDNLPNDTIRSCLLYCSLYPENCLISKESLIDCWIGEGFLNESREFGVQKEGVQKEGYYNVGILVHACLLEEVEEDDVKMHDVIRDMALWLACDVEKEKENYLVYAGAGLSEAPDVRKWKKVRRLSLMENQIENLSEVPTCPDLLTLFLNNNKGLKRIHSDFFQSMPRLKVLNLSGDVTLSSFPLGISKLVTLQHLDLSYTRIPELPKGLNALVNLKCLNLEYARNVTVIPGGIISSFSRLHVFRMFCVGYSPADGNGIISEGELEELCGLKYLEVLSLTLKNSRALQCVLSSHKLRSCTQALYLSAFQDSKSFHASALADLKHLNRLQIADCGELEELKMDCGGVVQNTCQHFVFYSLKKIEIERCNKLKNLTFLAFAPNLKSIDVSFCENMQEIVRDDPELMQNLNLFAKLHYLCLSHLPMLTSIYSKPLPFPHLKEMKVIACRKLEKLPLDSNSAKDRKIVIRGEREWRKRIQWEDQALQKTFSFKSEPAHRVH